jgi:hypothetical protein
VVRLYQGKLCCVRLPGAAKFAQHFRYFHLFSFDQEGATNPMSHVVQIQMRVHDPAALAAACRRLGLAEPIQGTTQLFSGEATGLLVQLSGWRYPAVIDTLTGTIKYDNYEGRWGEQTHLDRLLQMYAVEKAKLEARKKGFSVSEQANQDGSILIQIRESF